MKPEKEIKGKTILSRKARVELMKPLQRYFPFLVFFLALLSSVYVYQLYEQSERDIGQELYKRTTDEIQTRLIKRLQDNEQVLRGGLGLLLAKKQVNHKDWHDYFTSLGLTAYYPGIQGVGLSLWIKPEELKGHVEKMRASGFPDYKVWPEGERQVYSAIVFLEPFDWRNQRAFGYDMYSEAIRAKAMDRARNTGETSISGKITLVQETQTKVQPGFLIYLPYYRPLAPIATEKNRQDALVGFVYSPIRVFDLVHSTFGYLHKGVGFRLYDGSKTNPKSLLFDSLIDGQDHLPLGYQPEFYNVSEVEVYGHRWTFDFFSMPYFNQRGEMWSPLGLLAGGVLVSFLLALVSAGLVQTREKAEALAVEKTTELRLLEAKWRSLSEHLPDYILSVEKGLLIENANQPLPGLRLDEMVQHPVIQVLAHFGPTGNLEQQLEEVLQNASPVQFELTLSSPKQKQIHMDGHAVPRLIGGEAVGLLLRLTDVTQKKKESIELKQIKDRLELVIESGNIGTWEWDMSSHHVAVNDRLAQQLGFQVSELLPHIDAWQQRVHPDDQKQHQEAIQDHIEGKTPYYRHVHRLLHKKGYWVHVVDNGRITEWDDFGKPLKFIGTYTDISVEKQIEAKLVEANKTKDKFFSIIAHDLRSPFSAILGLVEVLEEQVDDLSPTERDELIDHLHTASYRAFNLVEELLTWAQSVSGRLAAHMEPVNGQLIVDHVISVLQANAESKHIQVINRIEPNLFVRADEKMLYEVLRNLVSNSLKFVPKGSRIWLESEAEEAGVWLVVRDEGPGVTLSEQATLFQIDHSFSTLGTDGEKGTGLGLHLCREFAEKMGGEIHYDASYTQGAKFMIRLAPLYPERS